MIWLVVGVLLWSAAHLFPSAAASLRARVAERIGPAYPGIFALVILASVGLMVLGWRSTPPNAVYTPPAWGRTAANGLMVIALILFAASGVPTNIKRVLRHPQLTGLGIWSIAHLLSNGDGRSLVLFGGLGLWAIAAIMFINRRDGAWQKPEPLPMAAEAKPIVGAIIGFAVLYLLHPYFAGVSASPGF